MFRSLLFIRLLAQVCLTEQTGNIVGGGCCAYNHNDARDYFPDKASVDFSAGFSVEYFSNYKVVDIPQRGEEYVLYQRGTPKPQHGKFTEPGTVFAAIPIERAAVLSNAYFPYFELLGERRSMVVTTKHDYLAEACLQKMALEDGLLDGVTNRDLTTSNPFVANNVDVRPRWPMAYYETFRFGSSLAFNEAENAADQLLRIGIIQQLARWTILTKSRVEGH